MTQFLMDYLAEAESDKIHYNVGEKDITTMYGIYRVQHPKAAIFKRIDEVAQLAGVTSASEYWLQAHIANGRSIEEFEVKEPEESESETESEAKA